MILESRMKAVEAARFTLLCGDWLSQAACIAHLGSKEIGMVWGRQRFGSLAGVGDLEKGVCVCVWVCEL